MNDARFDACLNEEELETWDSVKAVIIALFGNVRDVNYKILVERMLACFEKLDVHMSLKIHLLHYPINFFDNQLPTESDEQGERFHQTIMEFEGRFKGKRLNSMLADFCWTIAMH